MATDVLISGIPTQNRVISLKFYHKGPLWVLVDLNGLLFLIYIITCNLRYFSTRNDLDHDKALHVECGPNPSLGQYQGHL